MKNEVSKPLMVGVILVVVLVVAVIGWKMFSSSSGNTAAGGGTLDASSREAHFKDHPGDRAVFESMNKGAAPPGGGAALPGRPAPGGSSGR